MELSGTKIAILEIYCFYKFATNLLSSYVNLQTINPLSYYWLSFTVLTGFWEYFYLRNRKQIQDMSTQLLLKKEHVWHKNYNLDAVLPWNLSKIFYAEYGAHADREYMIIKDNWSNLIEGTHAIFCGINAYLALLVKSKYQHDAFIIFTCTSMATQLMNSILYIGEYIIQTKSIHHINYDRPNFPCGNNFNARPFMYINIFWTIMPIYVINDLLI